MNQTQEPPLDLWGIVELMGHRRLAGRLTEQTVAGVVLLRVDVPALDGSLTTQFYGGQAIYCLTPTSEEIARAVALHHQPTPVNRYELPVLAQAAQAIATEAAAEEDEEDAGYVDSGYYGDRHTTF